MIHRVVGVLRMVALVVGLSTKMWVLWTHRNKA